MKTSNNPPATAGQQSASPGSSASTASTSTNPSSNPSVAAMQSAAQGINNHDDFLLLFRRGLKFTEELLAENEKLRFRIAALEADAQKAADAAVRELRDRVKELEDERQRLLHSYREVETLNRDYQTRYAEIEAEHNNLANLYISSFQLHATTSFRDVVQVIQEIVINLVGVARFAMYLLDAPTQKLVPLVGEGCDVAKLAPIAVGVGVIGQAVAERRRVAVPHVRVAASGPVAIIPLATADHLVGAIVIDELLVQKDGLNAVDNELFNLLAVHGATALLAGLLEGHVGDAREQAISQDHAHRLLA